MKRSTYRRPTRMYRGFSFLVTLTAAPYLINILWWQILQRYGLIPPAEAATAAARICGVILIMFTVVYALGRLVKVHPKLNGGYDRWLRTTPWRVGLPLPNGCVGLIWEDALVVGCVAALGWWQHQADPVWVAAAFALAYAVPAWGLAAAQCKGHALALAFIVPAALYACSRPTAFLAVAIVAMLIADNGLRRSMARFPWPEAAPKKPAAKGWPVKSLSPQPPRAPIPVAASVTLCAWLAWTITCVEEFATHVGGTLDLRVDELLSPLMVFAFIVAFLRLVVYAGTHGSPAGLLTRLFTGRWIIPGYDKVLLGPLATVATGVAVPLILVQLVPTPAVISLSAAAILFVALASGPKLGTWQLTAPVRIRRVVAKNASAQAQHARGLLQT